MIFLENALGFFIQLFPCAVIIFLPFRDEAYRIRRRTLYLWVTLGCAAFACLYAAALCLRDLEKYPNHAPLSNSFMLLVMLLVLAAYVWLVKDALLKKILVFIVVLFYAVTVYTLSNMLQSFFFRRGIHPTIAYGYPPLTLALYAGFTALLLPLMLAVVVRPLKGYIEEIEPKYMKREFFVTLFSTVFYFIMIIFCDSVYALSNSSEKWSLLMTWHLLMSAMMLNQLLIYWLVFQESLRRKHDGDRQRAMELQQLQYERIVGDMENVRRMRHDIRHHYNALNDMLDRGQTREMKEYLAGLIETTTRTDTKVYCRNMMVNGLLQYYVGMAGDEGIRCTVNAECEELKIEPSDLTVLFGNAMENAINACRKCPKDRWIDVQVSTAQGPLAIEISNSCKEVRINRHLQTEDGFSPAEAFQSDHGGGYGLHSMAHTAQKYGGSARFRYNAEKETFTARIWLNIST